MQEPVECQVAQRRVFGLAPTGLLGALALLTFAAGVLLLVAGPPLAGILFLLAGALLGALWLEQTGHRQGRLRDVTGFASGALGAWAAAGPELARIRFEAARVTKARARALYELEQGDESAGPRLEALDARMEELAACANAVLARSRARVSGERLAAARTVVVASRDGGIPSGEIPD